MDVSGGDVAGFAAAAGNGVTAQPSEAQVMLTNFWTKMGEEIRTLNPNDFKTQELPLARIKKIMKLDEDVKMISAEAPVLFAKAAEMFVSELSLRAWIHTEENKRRTLQKNDISQAVSKYDQFDFLIDIVPRDEIKPAKREESSSGGTARAGMVPDQVQYYFQLAQHHQQALQQQTNSTTTTASQPQQQQPTQQTIQVQQAPVVQQQQQQSIQQQPQQVQFQVAGSTGQQQTIQTIQTTQASLDGSSTPQIIQIQAPQQQQPQQQQSTTQQAQGTTQVFQQIISPSGEVQNIPIQLSQSQLQAITMQMQGKQPGQPIVIQTNSNNQQQQQQDTNTQQQQQFSTQPIFQVPLNIGNQQVYIQQEGQEEAADS